MHGKKKIINAICLVSPKCEHWYHQKSVAVHPHLKDKLWLLLLGYLASGVEDFGKVDEIINTLE